MRFKPVLTIHPIELPAATGNSPSVLAFSMAKAGSTLLADILTLLSPHAGLTYFSVEDRLFAENVSPVARPAGVGDIFQPTGYCYGGFRQLPAYPIPILHSAKAMLLVRDPRDMITSLYFSLLSSHRIPESASNEGGRAQMLEARQRLSEQGINRFAEEGVRSYFRMYEGYIAQGFHRAPNVVIYRYEDVIYEKGDWIKDICDWFGWPDPAPVLDPILARVDVTVEGEREHEHIRQVHPGNYRKHLDPRVIARINRSLGEYMRIFGYL